MPKRKKKAAAKKKTHKTITLRLELPDYKKVKKNADAQRLPMASYCKMKVFADG